MDQPHLTDNEPDDESTAFSFLDILSPRSSQSRTSSTPGESSQGTPRQSDDPLEPSPLPTPTMSGRTVKINGVSIAVKDTKRDVPNTDAQVLHPRSMRSTLADKDLVNFIERATKRKDDSSDEITYILKNKTQALTTAVTLSNQIDTIRRHHTRFDMHSVFSIVSPEDAKDRPNLNSATTLDLYREYPKLTAEEVGESNRWYRLWHSDDECINDLNWSYEHLRNLTEVSLRQKVDEAYEKFSKDMQGGPLYLFLILDRVISHTQQSAEAIVQHLRVYKITDIRGEDVERVHTTISANVKTLRTIRLLPADIVKIVTDVLESSSVKSFTTAMETYRLNKRLSDRKSKKRVVLTEDELLDQRVEEVEDLLSYAEETYRELLLSNEWSGLKTKGNEGNPAQKAMGLNLSNGGGTPFRCFNCDETGHGISECPKPLNEERIKANKKVFYDAKKNQKDGQSPNATPPGPRHNPNQAPSGTGKWRKPEASENNKRIVDGQHYFWKESKKRWVPDRDFATPPSSDAANTAGANTPAAPGSTTQINTAIRTLSNALRTQLPTNG